MVEFVDHVEEFGIEKGAVGAASHESNGFACLVSDLFVVGDGLQIWTGMNKRQHQGRKLNAESVVNGDLGKVGSAAVLGLVNLQNTFAACNGTVDNVHILQKRLVSQREVVDVELESGKLNGKRNERILH